MSQPITEQHFKDTAAAYNRLCALRREKSPIVTAATQSQAEEIKTLEQYIGSMLLRHAGEFLNSYLCIKREYEPLINALAPRFTKFTLQAIASLEQRAQAVFSETPGAPEAPAPEVAPAPAPAPGNVVPVDFINPHLITT